jgi:ABC transporter substrate binding protein
VPKVVLDCPSVLAVVCELVAAGMPQHVAVNEEGEARGLASTRDHALIAGNTSGFHNFEPAVGGKWLGVLKQVAPQVRRVGVVHVPEITANVAFIRAADSISESLGVTVTGLAVRDAADIERVLTDFAQESNGGLIVTPSPLTATKRDVIIATAARVKLPAVYSFRFYVVGHSTRSGLLR